PTRSSPPALCTLSLHDALPICAAATGPDHGGEPVLPSRAELGPIPPDRPGDRGHDHRVAGRDLGRLLADTPGGAARLQSAAAYRDRKSTRLNSSHEWISYAVFC